MPRCIYIYIYIYTARAAHMVVQTKKSKAGLAVYRYSFANLTCMYMQYLGSSIPIAGQLVRLKAA